MRPVGEVSKTLLNALEQVATAERGLTLREWAEVAGICLDVADTTVKNLRRAGHVEVPRTRRVEHCKKPVAEYVPATGAAQVAANDVAGGFAALACAWG